MRVTLHYEETGEGEVVILVHGLFGASTNLRRIARKLSERFRVINVDLPNHGRSEHTISMTYADMREGLCEVMQRTGIDRANWVGHSMGGKAVMDLALAHPESVARLAVMDIAPVEYSHTHAHLIDAMLELDVGGLKSRAEAERALTESIPDASTRLFLMQNLASRDGRYQWRLNLTVLDQYLDRIMSFPEHANSIYTGQVLMLTGENSDYVEAKDHEIILRYFPKANFEIIAEAGHWLHADDPEAVCAALLGFLAR